MQNTSVSFASRDAAGYNLLSRAGKPFETIDLLRRDFLVKFCQGAGATLIPTRLWNFDFSFPHPSETAEKSSDYVRFHLHPRYRTERPLDAVLLKVQAELDRFPSEVYADKIGTILKKWSASLLRSLSDWQWLTSALAQDFLGASLAPSASRLIRQDGGLEIRRNTFSERNDLRPDQFVREWKSMLIGFSKIEIAEFQITGIDAARLAESPKRLTTNIRYEIVGSGSGFYREQRVGKWQVDWKLGSSDEFRVANWKSLDETQARSASPIYIDVTAAALGSNPSYDAQLMHGSDYWRTVLDGACGIDIYGHNGVSVADIDNDGFDDLYICQPAGLPNRLYRNRGDGTFEDITETSGLGILESTACALFADFNNDGHQDVILVRNSGPLLFLNDGKGKFFQKLDAFQFANPPQGTFTGAAVADYDRDGWLDVYFCLYSYYQGTGQYRYPSPYHDAENGPPNFLLRNNRDGSFRDVTSDCGLNKNNTRYSFCCGWNDYNNDGWADLYVVNDFGRKNLYRNNGDGTFTDVAAELGVEDVGAGMSVSWLDYDRDGAPDLYVGNMWTATGLRISRQDNFKQASSPQIRAQYQKHAMGNSLFRNGKEKFEDKTQAAGVGMGRWAWSSDAFDFDHDGYPDLYVTNGMVSGSSPYDLNSFFWRQVVAQSPDQAEASHDYEQAWNAINELIRADGTWSGYERNVFYANNRDGTFSEVSAVVGLDFVEDGRAFALADFDHDGRLEVALKNRNAPQLKVLKNTNGSLPPSISFRLRGVKSNRDAIGALVAIEGEAGRQVRYVQAGSGFLSQHSKDVFFGLGQQEGSVRASIHWPSGSVQQLQDLPINSRISVEEGVEQYRAEPFKNRTAPVPAPSTSRLDGEQLPASVQTWLLAPVLAPDFSLPDQSGKRRSLAEFQGMPVLLNFCAPTEKHSQTELEQFRKNYGGWNNQGLQLITVNVEDFVSSSDEQTAQPANVKSAGTTALPFPLLRGSEDVAAIYNLLHRQLFDRHRDLGVPSSFLIDGGGKIVKVYQGPTIADHVSKDFRSIPRTDADRLARALPFSSSKSLDFGRNYLSLGSHFFQRGYLDQAAVFLQQALQDDPNSAEALYGIGSVYLNQNKNAEARVMFERCVKLEASYPDTITDAWNNLGVLATREGHVADSIEYFQHALQLNPRHLLSLNNLGNAYRSEKRWDDARKALTLAVEVSPEDPEANYSLGMVFAQTNDPEKAYKHLQLALKARPNYPEALNNLGVLYMVTQRHDEAVASFERCIRVAPAFDQAYLNLARVYVLDGARDKARDLLHELIKQHPDHPLAKQMLEQLQ